MLAVDSGNYEPVNWMFETSMEKEKEMNSAISDLIETRDQLAEFIPIFKSVQGIADFAISEKTLKDSVLSCEDGDSA